RLQTPQSALFPYTTLFRSKTGMEQNNTRQETSTRAVRIGFLYFMDSSFHQSDNGFARKVPTMLVNSRRHQAFISSRKNCPPSIRDRKSTRLNSSHVSISYA